MKKAISNIAWIKSEDETVYGLMRQYNFTGLEIAPTRVWDSPYNQSAEEIKRFRKSLNDRGISIVAFQALLYGRPDLTIFDSEKIRNETLKYLKKNVDLATTLGAKVLVFGSPKNRLVGKKPKQECFKIAGDFFHTIGDYAYKNGVVIGIEPNPTSYGADFINNTDEAIELVKKTDSPGFKLHLDVGTLTINKESYQDTIKKAFPYLVHVHISEPFLNLIENKLPRAKTHGIPSAEKFVSRFHSRDKSRGISARNNSKHQEISQALRSIEYQGWISIEMKNNLLKDNTIAVTQAIDLVSKYY